MVEVVGLALGVGLVVGGSFWLGQRLADGAWLSKAKLRHGPMVLGEHAFWVVDRNDPEACCHLLEVLHAEQEQRESASRDQRTREGAGLL